MLAIGDLQQFLIEQKRSISEKFAELKKMFPENGKIITLAEAKLLVTLAHSRQIAQHHSDGVDYIEDMLHKQLVAAIGKELTPVDFTNYMRYHNRQLFKSEFEPNQFKNLDEILQCVRDSKIFQHTHMSSLGYYNTTPFKWTP